MATKTIDASIAKAKARTARYLATEKAKRTRNAYYLAHSAEIKERAKEWRKRNPDRYRALQKAHYQKNKATAFERAKAWNTANPEGNSARSRNYRARVNGAEGFHTPDDIKALYGKQRGRCAYCKIGLRGKYHVDHIKALSRGGSNWPVNLQLLCARCNNNKRATDPVEYARRIGLLI